MLHCQPVTKQNKTKKNHTCTIFLPLIEPLWSITKTTFFGMRGRLDGAKWWTKYPADFFQGISKTFAWLEKIVEKTVGEKIYSNCYIVGNWTCCQFLEWRFTSHPSLINEWQNTGGPTPWVNALLCTYICRRKIVPLRATIQTSLPEKTDGLKEE